MQTEGNKVELCPVCKRMTAERNHYNGNLVCYNRYCGKIIERWEFEHPENFKARKAYIEELRKKPARRIEINNE